jgi:hypothetical protein
MDLTRRFVSATGMETGTHRQVKMGTGMQALSKRHRAMVPPTANRIVNVEA